MKRNATTSKIILTSGGRTLKQNPFTSGSRNSSDIRFQSQRDPTNGRKNNEKQKRKLQKEEQQTQNIIYLKSIREGETIKRKEEKT